MKFPQEWRLLPTCALMTLMTVATLAQAQYVWLDEKGIKQLSDRPPPPSVPASKILKAPRANRQALAPGESEAPDQAGAAAQATAPARTAPTTSERNADFQKRKAEAVQLEQKTAREASQKAERAGNCDSARQNQRLLDSGRPMTSIDKNGERVFLSDTERALQAKNTQRMLADCK